MLDDTRGNDKSTMESNASTARMVSVRAKLIEKPTQRRALSLAALLRRSPDGASTWAGLLLLAHGLCMKFATQAR